MYRLGKDTSVLRLPKSRSVTECMGVTTKPMYATRVSVMKTTHPQRHNILTHERNLPQHT